MLGVKWNFGNPGSPQKPLFLPFWASSHSPARAALQQYCPCQSVCTFNYSMPIYALSHNRYKIMYVCQLITSLKKGMSAILYMLIMFEKDAFYVRQSKLKKGKQ